ncbi:MAG: hypothetical protein KTR26_20705 [Flammeovirgaceae bacterium]|nr:hypothetical protein [Flammeovirgaceae bacterium]
MKNYLFAILVIVGCGLFSKATAQCNSDLYSEKSMKKIAPGFLYEKSYRVDGRGGRTQKVEYSCILSKDTNYSFTMNTKDGGAEGMVFSLLDQRKAQVATNYVNNKFFTGIHYKCQSTGLYVLNFTFKDSKSHCGAAVLAFRR